MKTGGYLSPEPLLQSPGYLRTTAQRGLSVPTYAYAGNNPLTYVDPNGLWFRHVGGGAWNDIRALLLDPAIAPFIERMALDPTQAFDVYRHNGTSKLSSRTREYACYTSNAANRFEHESNYAPDYYDSVFPRLSPAGATPLQLLAHELGEAYGNAYSGSGLSDAEVRDMAHALGLQWQSTVP